MHGKNTTLHPYTLGKCGQMSMLNNFLYSKSKDLKCKHFSESEMIPNNLIFENYQVLYKPITISSDHNHSF